ncbi:MAG: hypothetical protein OXC10_04055 [Rhodospirillaceae bacterium]|nr:hypothetical protein [Rhodospirillaceae bacterium]
MRDRLAPDRLQAIGKDPAPGSDTAAGIRGTLKVDEDPGQSRWSHAAYAGFFVYSIQFVLRRSSDWPAKRAIRCGVAAKKRWNSLILSICIHDTMPGWKIRHAV